jgi:hypothetical protein
MRSYPKISRVGLAKNTGESLFYERVFEIWEIYLEIPSNLAPIRISLGLLKSNARKLHHIYWLLSLNKGFWLSTEC